MKTIFKVEKADLVGAIEEYPIEVVEKMLEEQVKQGNRPNVEVFQERYCADADHGGFDWGKSDDGTIFWIDVLENDGYDLFFKKYPKKANLVYIAGNNEEGTDIIKTLEKYGGINRNDYRGKSSDDSVLYYIEPNNNTIEMCCADKDKTLYDVIVATYTRIDAEEDVFEVSMEEVAKMFGVDVSILRIKK